MKFTLNNGTNQQRYYANLFFRSQREKGYKTPKK